LKRETRIPGIGQYVLEESSLHNIHIQDPISRRERDWALDVSTTVGASDSQQLSTSIVPKTEELVPDKTGYEVLWSLAGINDIRIAGSNILACSHGVDEIENGFNLEIHDATENGRISRYRGT
jgi:hypothetical protein